MSRRMLMSDNEKVETKAKKLKAWRFKLKLS